MLLSDVAVIISDVFGVSERIAREGLVTIDEHQKLPETLGAEDIVRCIRLIKLSLDFPHELFSK